jgi:hypothetical protein
MAKKQAAPVPIADDDQDEVISRLEEDVARLDARLRVLEDRLRQAAAPTKRVVSPQIAWLRENREFLKEQYPGQWIAVTDEGLHGHADQLGKLHELMKEKGIEDATFVHVSEPLVPR